MPTKYTKIFAVICLALAGAGIVAGLIRTNGSTDVLPALPIAASSVATSIASVQHVRPPADNLTNQVSQTVLSPNITFTAGGKTYRAHIDSGETVLELMRTLASTSNFIFSGRDYPSLGFFVESINGKKNANGNYWFLYVNGKSSNTGVSETRLKAGDAIEWKHEKNY